ncbi:pentapeptide repeat-containing protein [Arthrobacter sp. TE12232]
MPGVALAEAGALAAGALDAGALALGEGTGVWLAWAATEVPVTAAAVNTATTTPVRRAVRAPRFCSGTVCSRRVCSRTVFSGAVFPGAVFSGVVLSGAVFSGVAGCGAVSGAVSSEPAGSVPPVEPRLPRRAAALACARRANGLPSPPPVGVPELRLPALGLRTSSATPAMISRPPSTMNGMAQGVEVSFGKVIVMVLGAGLVPSVARSRDQSPSAGAFQE